MATVAADAEAPKIDIGRVVQRGLEVLGRNLPGYLLLAVLLAGIPNFLLQYSLLAAAETGGMDGGGWLFGGIGIAGLLVTMATGLLLQAAIVRSAVLHLDGRPVHLVASLAEALKLILPLIGLLIVTSIIFMIGALLLIVPGIIAYVALIVVVPVLVEERRGVLDSIARSADLTRGSRWRIFGLLLVAVLAYLLLAGAAGLAGAILPLAAALEDPVGLAVAEALLQTVNQAIVAAMVASLYVELRTVKEGATSSALAAVFD